METKEFNFDFRILYWLLGFVMGYIFSIVLSVGAFASENQFLSMYDTLPNREGYDNIVVYNSETDNYILYSLDSVDYYVLDNKLYFNGSIYSKGGSYFWSKEYNCWTADKYSYPENLDLLKYTIVHSDVDISYLDSDEIYFYKTNKIISNKLYQGVNTVLYQKLIAIIKIIIPVAVLVFCSMIAVYLIPKILYKFF